jgi:hypothetical protein
LLLQALEAKLADDVKKSAAALAVKVAGVKGFMPRKPEDSCVDC